MDTQQNDNWYYVSETNERIGPVSIRELSSLVSQGIITPKALVWNPAEPEWIPAATIRNLLNIAKTPVVESPPSPISRPALLPAQELKPRKASFIFPRLVATCIGATLLGAMVSGVLYGLEQPAWFGFLAFIAVLLLGIFSAQVAYRKERYQLQGTRLVCHRGGLFSDEATEFEIRNITHVKLMLPWLRYRLFGVGHVIVETAGSSKPMIMRAIRDPEAIYAEMRERMKSNGYDLSQRVLLHEEKPALIGVLGECIGMLVGAAFFFFVFFGGILSDADIPVEEAKLAVFGFLFLIIFTFIILHFFDLMRRTYRVYNDIVVYEEGFLTRHNAFIPYENIADSNTKRTLIDQILGLYDVVISCQGSSSEIMFRRLKNGIHLSGAIDLLVSSAAKKSKPDKAISEDSTSKSKRPARVEPETVPAESMRMAEYRIHALRLLVPQMLLLPLFPLWVLAMLKSLILMTSTRYFVRSGSLRHSYKFLTVDDREFSYDKITGVVIKKNLWDKWFGTMTLKFWSIGSGKAMEFAHVHCSQVDLPALMRQVGIPPASQESIQMDASFGLFTWLRAQMGVAIAMAVVSAGVVAAAIMADEPLIYLILLSPVIIVIGGLVYSKLYYSSQHLRFHEHHIEAEQGVIAKSCYYVRYKNVKRITATRYPGGEEGSLKFYVAGEEQIQAQGAQAKGVTVMKQCSFTSGMLPKAFKSAALLDDILSGRTSPSLSATPAEPSEIIAESPRSVGSALAALFLISILLFPLIVLLPITIPITIIRVKNWRYRIEDFRIVTNHGVLFRSETSVLLDRVDSLQQSQGLLNKIFRNGKVTIMTAGSSKPDLTLIDSPAYLRLYQEIRSRSEE